MTRRKDHQSLLVLLAILVLGQAVLVAMVWQRIGAAEESIARTGRITGQHLRAIEAFVKYTTSDVWIDLETESGPQKGAEAPVVQVVEFADFQCPACKQLAAPLADLVAEHPGQIQLLFKHFPIADVHPHAHAAALAGICAEKAGSFWPFHDAMFRGQEELNARGDAYILEVGESLGLDRRGFVECIEAKETRQRLEADLDLARRLVIQATPTLFINGRRIEGVQWSMIKAAIGYDLRRLGSRHAAVDGSLLSQSGNR